MKKTKILSLFLATLMLVLCFAGCGKEANYGTIDGKKIDANLFETMVRANLSMIMSYGYPADQLKSMLDQASGEDGTTQGEFMKKNILEELKQVIAIEKLAKENDISLSNDDKAYLEETKASYIEQQGGKAEFVKMIKEQGFTEETFDDIQENNLLQQKVFNALCAPGGIYSVDQNEVVADVVANNVRVRHIVIVGSESDADFAEKKAKAEAALKRARAGEDFEALIAEYGEDPGMETYVDGYVFNKEGILADSGSPLDPTFTSTSFSIGVNEISDIVLSTSGLHIIKRLPLDEEFVIKNISTYYEGYAAEVFSAKVLEIAEKIEVKTTEEFNNLDLATFIPSTTTDDGHNH